MNFFADIEYEREQARLEELRGWRTPEVKQPANERLTRGDLDSMSAEDINAARRDGTLNHLLEGTNDAATD